jgi:hypothetical protein
MTYDEKKLLMKDLCGRLPYGVKCYAYQYKIDGNDCECAGTLTGINGEYFYLSDRVSVNGGKTYDERYREVKPYLRPIETLTEEESKELSKMGKTMFRKMSDGWFKELANADQIEWLNEHMFDYRGLIPMGLALELTDW